MCHKFKRCFGFAGTRFESYLNQKAFFLESADSLGRQFHGDFLAVDSKSFGLQVRLPYFLGMALRKAHIVAVLFAFTG